MINNKHKLLITGGYGFLGTYLYHHFYKKYYVIRLGHKSGETFCDLTKKTEIQNLIKKNIPSIIIHTAAETNVDFAEKQPEIAIKKNITATKNLIESLPQSSKIVYISTDQVYSEDTAPHMEEFSNPLNVYGKTKLEGEKIAMKLNKCLILRTNFFGKNKNINKFSLSDFIINKLERKQDLFLFKDVFFNPLHVSTLTESIDCLIENDINGIFNLGSKDTISKYDFGMKIAEMFNFPKNNIYKIESKFIKKRAPRNQNLYTDVAKIEKVLNRNIDEILKLKEVVN